MDKRTDDDDHDEKCFGCADNDALFLREWRI